MRPGWKTSEFWLAVGGKVLIAAGVVAHLVPGAVGAAAAAVVAGAYAVGRAITKANAPAPDLGPVIKDVGHALVGALGGMAPAHLEEPPSALGSSSSSPPAPARKL